ncbi:MAG: hypothetical protein DWQ34_01645 [Planctomycetota bacterium]|nr:MAG: hypothetical protein DWQ29_05660 [Planctomycetota bacterium]REJ97651.1 MAG: hypothetical protein DWQ34_01645 [Planctomycetota bacterium]REK19917.1 MAG: hypothetical protein DWQ41_26675 [Planctomycetota bacterium]REK27482.1 MAG: hypothetical protein DWQ45_25690 [Planctomycetota bacterium]
MIRCLLACLASIILLVGCQQLDLKLPQVQTAEEKQEDNSRAALRGEEGHSNLIGDYVNVAGLNTVVLHGVGLVVGLDGTGDSPPPSGYAAMLLDDMRKRKVEDPNQLLGRPDTTLVMVRAYLPPLIRKGERFDVEVRLPDGSEATSLEGGMLMNCDLSEQMMVPGQGVLKNDWLAIAGGPVLTGGAGDSGTSGSVRQGVIPGGAVYRGDDRNLSIYVRPDYKSIRMAHTIAKRIGQRFHDYDRSGIKQPLAEALTNSKIELIVHSRYRDNYPRYLQCIRHITLRDQKLEGHLRLQRLQAELMKGPTAEQAALELEAIGPDAVPVLLQGLKSESLEVRFHSAQALAYLNRSEAAPVLREAIAQEPAFRIYGLAAMTAIEDPAASIELHKLLDHDSIETRYGAVRALSEIDDRDAMIAGEKSEQGYTLRVVRSSGEPMVHVTRRKKAEVVVFGEEQQFLSPMVVSAGKRFLVKADPAKPVVSISRFTTGRPVVQQKCSREVAEVIRTLMEMDATYPEVVQMLLEAENQRNLVGVIGVDALPRAGRTYQRPVESLASAEEPKSTTVGSEGTTPNLFQAGELDGSDTIEPEEEFETATETAESGSLGEVGLLVE